MKKLFHTTYIIVALCLLGAGGVSAQQIEPRIAGLETNGEYMSLLREDAQLQIREDSIVKVVEGVRRQLREDVENRQKYTQEILQLENQIFDLRNAKGRLVDRINLIEQEWVLSNLDNTASKTPAPTPSLGDVVPDSLKVRNLVDNIYFSKHLPTEDYTALRRAQTLEPKAVDYVNRYFANHKSLDVLARQYAEADVEAAAQEIQTRFAELELANKGLSDSLASTWNYIADNKSYAYSYLLDRLGRDDLLSREEELLGEAMRKINALSGQTASDAVVDYFLRKGVLVDYETAVAGALGLDAARDSLQGVASQLSRIDFHLPKVAIQERLFIEYTPVEFSVSTPYTYENPIPECRVYAKGTIYRILLGVFNSKRAASLFRGAYPLSYQVGEDGKWSYYAGGFATHEEAVEAQKLLKSKGFLRPEVVVWHDGQLRNLSRDPNEQPVVVYRVEIAGETLSDAVRAVITQAAEGRELSRVGQQMFVIGLFEDKAAAERLAEAIRGADAALEIKVAEFSE